MHYQPYILAFLIGSSWITFFPWFIGFRYYHDQNKFYSDNCLTSGHEYFYYSLLAPLYIGLMAALAIFLSKNIWPRAGLRWNFFIVGIISAILTSIGIRICRIYDFTEMRYWQQYLRLLFYHFILYNLIIYQIYSWMQ